MHSTPTFGGFPSKYLHAVSYGKSRMYGYPMVNKFRRYVDSFWHDPRTWQTDRQTPHDGIGGAFAYIARQKLMSLKIVQGHWKWRHSIEHIRHQSAIVTIALSCMISNIKRDIGRKSLFWGVAVGIISYRLVWKTRMVRLPNSGKRLMMMGYV